MKRIFNTVKSRSIPGKEYSVVITLDDYDMIIYEKCSCTCPFGSFYGQSKYYVSKGIICWHMKETIKQYFEKCKNQKSADCHLKEEETLN